VARSPISLTWLIRFPDPIVFRKSINTDAFGEIIPHGSQHSTTGAAGKGKAAQAALGVEIFGGSP
jgi:hypothetical protein